MNTSTDRSNHPPAGSNGDDVKLWMRRRTGVWMLLLVALCAGVIWVILQSPATLIRFVEIEKRYVFKIARFHFENKSERAVVVVQTFVQFAAPDGSWLPEEIAFFGRYDMISPGDLAELRMVINTGSPEAAKRPFRIGAEFVAVDNPVWRMLPDFFDLPALSPRRHTVWSPRVDP